MPPRPRQAYLRTTPTSQAPPGYPVAGGPTGGVTYHQLENFDFQPQFLQTTPEGSVFVPPGELSSVARSLVRSFTCVDGLAAAMTMGNKKRSVGCNEI